jgi:hypothetical protein
MLLCRPARRVSMVSQADLFPPVETKTLLANMQRLILYCEILQAQRLIHHFKTLKETSKAILPGPRKFEGMQTAYTIWTGTTRSSLAF